MLSSFLDRMRERVHFLQVKYHLTVRNLNEHISMRPKDVVGRSVHVGNWSTILVMAILYPILLYSRGLDVDLLMGMFVHIAIFWGMVVGLVIVIQVIWLFSYFISLRFGPLKALDFEILDKIFGADNQRDYYDSSDMEDSDMTEMKRASG